MWGRNQINIPEPVQSALVPNGFLVASARRDERISRESRPVDETLKLSCGMLTIPPRKPRVALRKAIRATKEMRFTTT